MAARAGITIEGGRALRSSLRRAQPELLDELKVAHGRAAAFVSSAAQPRSPRSSGRLAGTVRGSGTRTAAVIRAGRATVPYAGVQHFGWPARNIEPHPWISDTAQDTEPVWSDLYADAVQRVLNTIKGT